MANFFNASSGEDITTLKVTKGTKFRIGLYGGAPGGVRLNVTTARDGSDAKAPDPAVTFIAEQGSWRLIYEIDSSRMQGEKVRACWDGNDYSAPVALAFGAAPGAGKAEIRLAIVQLARSFVPRAHYLWGTAGNTPGSGDGNAGGGKMSAATMRAPGLSPSEQDRDKVLGVCMAVQPHFDGYNTCAGRSRGKGAAALEPFLEACRQKLDGGQTDQTTWPGGGGGALFPRKYYFRGELAAGGAVVWGESCAGVRHFDCVGLVNYCYAKHWYRGAFGLDIPFFRNPQSGTVPLTGSGDLMDADILVKPGNGHIGMLFRNGQAWSVVQAESTEIGLTDTAVFDAKQWDRFRMQDAFLV
jgi:hypothetical protein